MFSGKRVALVPSGGNPTYYVEDILGSARVLTTNTGVVCYDADFYPYGTERPYTTTCPQNYKFEGKERDAETSIGSGNTNGNDEFGARYYSNRFGRWLSADWSSVPVAVPYANLTNPQTLNLYSMVGDDPESFSDLDGHCGEPNNPCHQTTGSDTVCREDGCHTVPNAPPPNQQPLNLCAQTSGCTQVTNNGVTTVTVVSRDANVVTNQDGSITMTSTTTTQTYTFNQGGNMIGGQYQTEGTALTVGTNGQATKPISDSGTLTLGNAMHQFGAQAVDQFQSGFADTRGTMARLPGTVAADAKAHPGAYIFKAAEVGALFVPVAQEAEGVKLSLELHVGLVELADALTDK
jgi:RHS repeat-associated protein